MGKYLGVFIGIVIGALAAVAWVATAEEGAEPAGTQTGPGGDRYSELEKEKGKWRETWVLPGADFGKFSKVYLWEPEFQYRDVGPARRTRSTMMTHKREFGMSEEDKATFEDVVSEAFMKEMSKGKRFELVEEIGPSTLILRGAFLDVISKVPPEMVGRSDIYLASVGEATFVMELLDSDTGSVLALVAERRAIQPPGGQVSFSMPTNRVTVISDVRRFSADAARKMRTALDKAIKEKQKETG